MELALYDKDFLLKLDQYPYRKTCCKIVALNWNEDPVAEITSNIVSGSINIDGSSAVRRTATLSLITNDLKIDTIVWRAQTKIRIFIGLYNEIDKKYDDIIWYPQGLFIITSFNSSISSSGCTINIQAKDKMCLLNGDVSGALWASHDFSQLYITKEDNSIVKTYIPIKDIIREAVHTYALEPYSNIIINDLDECGVELLEYIGTNSTMYIFKQRTNNSNVWNYQIAFSSTSPTLIQVLEQAIANNNGVDEGAEIVNGSTTYVVQKRISADSIDKIAGYRATDLTYPSELVISVGGTINDLLKKIVDLLGEFEYFYDLDGHFVFQRKKIYINTVWTNAVIYENTTYYDSMETATDLAYDFAHGILINSFSNTPKLNNIKNDYSIWGLRKSVSGTDMHIHLRYAIDHKPEFYYSLLDKKLYLTTQYDWRELIYQMAKDNLYAETAIASLKLALAQGYYHYTIDDSELHWQDRPFYKYDITTKRFIELKSETELQNCIAHKILLFGRDQSKVITRLTTDQINKLSNILGFNYTLYQLGSTYYPKMVTAETRNIITNLVEQYNQENIDTSLIDEIKEWQQTYHTGYEAYYTDILGFWRYMYKIEPDFSYNDDYYILQGYSYKEHTIHSDGSTVITYINENNETVDVYYGSDEIDTNTWQTKWQVNGYWNPNLFYYNGNNVEIKEPTALYFWLDFCNTDGELAQYSVDVIGRRSQYVNDKDVKAIYFRETPNLLFVNSEYNPVEGEEDLNYCKINIVPPISNYFRISTQGKSAKEALDALLYENTLAQESISLQTIPIYYLEPNKRIRVFDENTNINGEYIIKSLSIPLNYDGFMTITANRAVERIL